MQRHSGFVYSSGSILKLLENLTALIISNLSQRFKLYLFVPTFSVWFQSCSLKIVTFSSPVFIFGTYLKTVLLLHWLHSIGVPRQRKSDSSCPSPDYPSQIILFRCPIFCSACLKMGYQNQKRKHFCQTRALTGF